LFERGEGLDPVVGDFGAGEVESLELLEPDDVFESVAVWIGLNSPRIPSGASGFRSKLSCWANPPERKM